MSSRITLRPSDLVLGARYNWRDQPERLAYLGYNLSGNGRWHQFAKTDSPHEVWCENKDEDIEGFEETTPYFAGVSIVVLRAAAKAAGIPAGMVVSTPTDVFAGLWYRSDHGAGVVWNPLSSQDDLMDMARTCSLTISFAEKTVWKRVDGKMWQAYWGEYPCDPRDVVDTEAIAITRVAAACEAHPC